ncbi:MAG TPA: tetratricopeptide repeat protein [Planctomycetaceae bacterium]|nr:tetratricopeptide repeat protein [Planctomycetaceae bacterium]
MTSPRFLTAAVAAMLVLAAASRGDAADEITRKGSAAPLRGEITEFSRTEVTIKTGLRANQRDEKVPVNVIARIEWDGEPSKLSLNRNAEAAGRYGEAIKGYGEALAEVPGENARLQTDVTFLIARATARQALVDPPKLDDAIAKLEAFRSANSNHFRHFEATSLLGELYLAKRDFIKAAPIFQQLEQAPWNDYKMAAKNAGGRLNLLNDKPEAAQADFDSVLAIDATSPGEVAERLQALLGKATALQRLGQPAEAQQEIERVIEQADNNDSETLAEAYVRLGDSLQAQNKPQEALVAYLHVDVIPKLARESQHHSEALLHLSNLWNAVSRPDRAGEARDLLMSRYPTSDAARKLSAPAAGSE